MSTSSTIPCCLCGTLITPNAANQCGTCLAQEINLSDRIQRGPGGADWCTIYQCRQCRRYMRTEKHYEAIEPESPELLALCLKHLPALSNHHDTKLHVVDAGWIWTEPHSMRFKLHLTVRTEIHSTTVQQRVSVELRVAWKMCPECNREYTNREWHALVQIRQKRDDNKQALRRLEMALAKHAAIRKYVLRIDAAKNGFDFYFLSLPHAQSFASFCQRIAPMRVKTSSKLVSQDVKNNTANMKYTITCDILPFCRDDLVLIGKTAREMLAGHLAVVLKVSSTIHLVDASPKRNATVSMMELSPEPYYKSEKLYTILQESNRLVKFVVLDVELCGEEEHSSAAEDQATLYQGPNTVEKYALADITVARESDFGVNDVTFSCVSHLGHLLSVGDLVLGYDLSAHVTDWELQEAVQSSYVLPDVVLVKKIKGDAEHENDGDDEGRPRMTKKKERRQKRKEGKRMKELEESAVRMGFFEDGSATDAFENELENDPALKAELEALEREFAALDAPTKSDEAES